MKLDFEQRREAIELEEWVTDHPDLAAAQIVSLRSECQRLRDEIEVALASAPAVKHPDEARLDKLEALGTPGLWWHARESGMGRGYRLHQSKSYPGCATARQAIDSAAAPTDGRE